MLTEEQKNCKYCNIKLDGDKGSDFGAENGWVQLSRINTLFHIRAWGTCRQDVMQIRSEPINYCPICGRKLNKESNNEV